MKKIIILLVALMVTFNLSAQQKKWRTINVNTCVLNTTVTFTNGTQYGDHIFLGLGMGVDHLTPINITLENTTYSIGGYSVPIFMDGKWRLFDTWLSPSLRVRIGAMYNFDMVGAGVFAYPEIGLDISRRLTLSVGWNGQMMYSMYYGAWYDVSAQPCFGLSWKF